jgi:hypothetical protein
MMDDVLQDIVRQAFALAAEDARLEISSREIQTAVRMRLPGELAKHAVSEGTKFITRWSCRGEDGSASASKKAGLDCSVSATHARMKQLAPTATFGAGAPVYATAVWEYLAAEVLELSGTAARDDRSVFIGPRHIMLSVRNDEELNVLFKGTIPVRFRSALRPPPPLFFSYPPFLGRASLSLPPQPLPQTPHTHSLIASPTPPPNPSHTHSTAA